MTTTASSRPIDGTRGVAAEETFRPIQYMGSKVRVLDQIRETIDAVDPTRGPAVDLFSGSGVVAASLGRTRPVTAVDVQEYARILASALLDPARFQGETIDRLVEMARHRHEELAETGLGGLLAHEATAVRALEDGDPNPLCEIVEHGSIVAFELDEGPAAGALADALADVSHQASRGLTLTRHYGGVFFGYGQALMLDCLLEDVRALPAGAERDTGLAAVLGAASECVTSVGSHFAQPIRPRDRQGRAKSSVLQAAARRRRRDAPSAFADLLARYAAQPEAEFETKAVRGDYREFLTSSRGGVSAVYADPPYTRDHYSRFYHVLETIALGDDPQVSTVTVGARTSLSRGLYRVDRHQSPFCIRSQAVDAFQRLFAGVRGLDAPLVLSYSPYTSGTAARPQPRLMTIADLADLAGEHFDEVDVRSAGPLTHSKFNSQHLNGVAATEAESLLICRP